MTNPTQPVDLLSQLTGRTVEAFSVWADANQKVLRELVDLSAATGKEGVRLHPEDQSHAVGAVEGGERARAGSRARPAGRARGAGRRAIAWCGRAG